MRMPPRTIVGVMGRGDGASPEDVAIADHLGERIAREGWVLLTGGMVDGVMGAANRGAKRIDGSLTIGILPGANRAGMSPDVDIPIVTDIGGARNNVNVLSCDVVIACGRGGAGTISEIAHGLKGGKRVIVLAGDSRLVDALRDVGPVIAVKTVDEAIEAARSILADSF